MPIVDVEGQQFEFPDGTPDEVIGESIRQHFATQPAQQAIQPAAQPAQALPQQAARQRPIPQEFQTLAQEVGPFEAGLIAAGRGLTTLGRAVGVAEPEDPAVTASFQALEKERPVATTVGEIAGEAAPFLIPGLGIGAIPARAGQIAATAALGAAEAGLIARGRGGDIGQQLFSAGIGGTVAGALEVAIPVLGRIGGKAIRRILGRAPKGAVVDATGKPSQELVDALAETGQTFDDVVKEAQEELTKKAVDPKEAARKAFLKSQKLDPTRAQITRNAADFQAQQEAAKTSSRVRSALEKQEAILTTRFNDAILETGGTATSPTSTVIDALTEKATKLDQEIGDLYGAARKLAPGEKNIRFDALRKKLRELMPADRRTGGSISAIIGDMKARGIVNEKGKVIGKVSVETAEELRKTINSLHDTGNPFNNMLLRQVKDQLDDDVFKVSGNDFFNRARGAKATFEKELNRAKISKFDSRKANLVRDVLENKIDPDQFTDKVVFGKTWRADDLKQLKDYISTDDAGRMAFDDLRAEAMQKIRDKAFIGPIDADGFQALSADKLQRAIQSIGNGKMKILFTGREQKFLKDMLEVSKLRQPVRGTALGRGPSAQAIGRLEQKLREIPALGALVNVINVDAQGRAALKARPAPIKDASVFRIPEEVRAVTAPAAVAITQQESE